MFFELIRVQVFTKAELQVSNEYFDYFNKNNSKQIESIGLKHINLKEASAKIRLKLDKQQESLIINNKSTESNDYLTDAVFVHLHNHTQFSVLQSTISVPALVKAAVQEKMPAVAMTDHANLMGAFHFVRDILNHNKAINAVNSALIAKGEEPTGLPLKPIVGCEFLFVMI